MFTQDGFHAFIENIARLNNISIELAGKYAALIGDTPELAEDGRVIVRDDTDKEIARVWISMEGGEDD